MKQRSPEWYAKRGPRITASRLGDVIADPATVRYQGYLQSIVDKIMGYPNFDDKYTRWADHGIAWEDEAIADWEFRKFTEYPDKKIRADKVGFITHPIYDFIGCSPDGKTWGDPRGKGGLEAKCHKSIEQWELFRDQMPAIHIPQVQGQLWITGWGFIDFISFFKSIRTGRTKTTVHTIYPDLDYHAMLEKRCLAMWDDVQRAVAWEKV